MKLSSKVLAGSLASAGMVLSLVAPAITAQAAKTSGVVDADGNVNKTTDASGLEDAGVLGKGNLAIAYDEKGDASGETGTATAQSNAAVQVINGVLVLDKVPDFNFGAAAQKTTKSLQNNDRPANNQNTAIEQDGNDAGTLQVTESRQSVPGFTLSASVGNFVGAKEAAITGGGEGKDFILNLGASPLTLDTKPLMNGNVAKDTNAVAITSDGTSSGNVMDEAKGAYSTGTYATNFDAKSGLVSLYVGDMGNKAADTPSVQAVHSTITWTLNAKPATVTPGA